MSSSTSSFRRALSIAILVILAFALMEVVTRRFLFASSKDIKRFSTYPARADRLMRDNALKVAFVGNSITERGIDTAAIGTDLGVATDAFVADDSHLNTWTWIVRSLFWKRHRRPDVLVVTFHAHSLEDGRSIELGRVAQFFTEPSDWPELFDTVTSLGERAEVIASSYWATYAVRDRIRERVLGLAPGYKDLVRFEERAMKLATKTAPPAPPTWKTLTRFLELARQNETLVVFVAFPTRSAVPGASPYHLDPEVVRRVTESGMVLLDLRQESSLAADKDYDDEIHLAPSGRQTFTKLLAEKLAPIVAPKRRH